MAVSSNLHPAGFDELMPKTLATATVDTAGYATTYNGTSWSTPTDIGSTHKHENVRSWLDKHPRFHLHFTPTSSSWLNLVWSDGSVTSQPSASAEEASEACPSWSPPSTTTSPTTTRTPIPSSGPSPPSRSSPRSAVGGSPSNRCANRALFECHRTSVVTRK